MEMRSRTIAKDSWREELDSFSRRHDGWLVSITTQGSNGNVATVVQDVPLDGVSPASPQSDDIAILVGREEHLMHEVHQPVSLRIELTADEAERALIISDKAGTTTTIEFRSPMRPEDVDGLPAR